MRVKSIVKEAFDPLTFIMKSIQAWYSRARTSQDMDRAFLTDFTTVPAPLTDAATIQEF